MDKVSLRSSIINKKLATLPINWRGELASSINLEMSDPGCNLGRICISCSISENEYTTIKKSLDLNYIKRFDILQESNDILSKSFKNLFGFKLPDHLALEIKECHKAVQIRSLATLMGFK